MGAWGGPVAMARGVLFALVLVGTTGRAHADDPWWGRDKALHFGISAGLTIAAWGVSVPVFEREPPRLALAAGVGLTAGIAKELADLAGLGDPSWRDFTWDLVGVAVGLLLSFGIDRLWVEEPARPPP